DKVHRSHRPTHRSRTDEPGELTSLQPLCFRPLMRWHPPEAVAAEAVVKAAVGALRGAWWQRVAVQGGFGLAADVFARVAVLAAFADRERLRRVHVLVAGLHGFDHLDGIIEFFTERLLVLGDVGDGAAIVAAPEEDDAVGGAAPFGL